MSFRTGRRMNDGNMTGRKQDRFRNSSFEYDYDRNEMSYDEDDIHFGGVTRASGNTLGVGRYNENRGRRGEEDWNRPRTDNPFENGRLANWNRRQGWDDFYDRSFDRGNRSRGGAQIGHDEGGMLNRGRGPRGYKRPDNRIYEDVCEMLARSPDVDASDIEVSIKDGVVFLNGAVSDRNMKRMAELEIENISGVIDVQNLLSISRGDSQAAPNTGANENSARLS